MSRQCLKCSTNDARYINSANEWLCGVCDVLSPWRSVRISDIGELVRVVDTMVKRLNHSGDIYRLYREAMASVHDLMAVTSVSPSK